MAAIARKAFQRRHSWEDVVEAVLQECAEPMPPTLRSPVGLVYLDPDDAELLEG